MILNCIYCHFNVDMRRSRGIVRGEAIFHAPVNILVYNA